MKCSRCFEDAVVTFLVYTEKISRYKLTEEKWCVSCLLAYAAAKKQTEEMDLEGLR